MISSIIGWTGMFLLTLGFYFISSGKLKGNGLLFLSTQMLGCFFVGINSFTNGAYPSVLVQAICLIIGFKAIISAINEKTKNILEEGSDKQ